MLICFDKKRSLGEGKRNRSLASHLLPLFLFLGKGKIYLEKSLKFLSKLLGQIKSLCIAACIFFFLSWHMARQLYSVGPQGLLQFQEPVKQSQVSL